MDPIALAHELADVFRADAYTVDRSGRFPRENIDLMRARGYLSIAVPEELGGGGADLETVCHAQAIVASACASTALASNMHIFGVGAGAERWSQGDRDNRGALDLSLAGAIIGGSVSDAAAGVASSTATARRVDGGFVVSGRKHFCSLAPVLDFFIASAKIEGHPLLLHFTLPRDTPGLTFVDTWDVMGMRGTGSWDVVLDDIFVAEGEAGVTEDAGADWQPAAERPYAWFAFTLSAIYLGIARAAADFAYEYVNSKSTPGTSVPKSHQPEAMFAAGDIELLLRPAVAFLEHSCRRRDAGETLRRDEIAAVKHIAVNNAAQVVDRSLGLVGGQALFRSLPLERYYRDVRAGQFHPLGNDLGREVIGRAALGVES